MRTGHKLTWHIGVIESVNENGANVAYLVQSNAKNKANWIFPESATTFQTPKEQIIANDICVEYGCATIIRCKVRCLKRQSVHLINYSTNMRNVLTKQINQKTI